MNHPVVITSTGFYTPPNVISNEEIVQSYNLYADQFNASYRDQIEKGEIEALAHSSASFIEKASGIRQRFVIDKKGILDPQRMRPFYGKRDDEILSIQAEFACQAIQVALERAQKKPHEIDGLIVSCSNHQRSYPSVAIEIQNALGTQGYAYDMNMACSSATFGLSAASNAIQSNQNKCIVLVSPEITTAHVDFRDRDSHFIFGDICTAVVLESKKTCKTPAFEIVSSKLSTSFSNNIRNNGGFLSHTEIQDTSLPIHYFKQNGRKVFKEVIPLVEEHILLHLEEQNLSAQHLKRLFLHQANVNMNVLIAKKVLGREPTTLEAPLILNQYANTASCGSIIAFHLHHHDFQEGELGLICSFGAGYSIGSVIVRKTT